MGVDQIAMWIGYTLMIGSAWLLAGFVFCWVFYTMFWRVPEEASAFLKFIRWKAEGKPSPTPAPTTDKDTP